MLLTADAPIRVARPTPMTFPALDGLRGLAALMVVVDHFLLKSGTFTIDLPMHAALSGIVPADMPFGTGVELFFVLSGFLLFLPFARAIQHGMPLPDTRRFYIRRARRILPGYWAALVILFPFATGTVSDFVAHAFMLHDVVVAEFSAINGVFWTLAIEWQFYMALPLIARSVLWAMRPATRLRVIGGAASGSVLLVVAFHFLDGTRFISILYPFGYAPVFACGMIAAWLYTAGVRLPHAAIWYGWAIIAGIIALSAAHVLTFSRSDPTHWCVILPVLGIAYSVIVLASCPNAESIFAHPALRRCGTISYSLYLWHLPILLWLMPIFLTVLPMTWLSAPLLFVACVVPIGIWSGAYYWVIERPFLVK